MEEDEFHRYFERMVETTSKHAVDDGAAVWAAISKDPTTVGVLASSTNICLTEVCQGHALAPPPKLGPTEL
eukprot:scaffold195_cov359-Prasinococcus_capsulatus_cf.AAC.8